MEEDYIKGFSEVLKANREFLNLQHYSNFILDEFTKNCFNCYLKGI